MILSVSRLCGRNFLSMMKTPRQTRMNFLQMMISLKKSVLPKTSFSRMKMTCQKTSSLLM